MPKSLSPTDIRDHVRAFDDRVDARFDEVRGHPVFDRLMYGASELGDFSMLWHMVGLARGLTSDERADEAIRLSVILACESVLVNGVIKSFFRRRRPLWDQPRAFRIRRPRSSSFPSGHASAAFTAATILSEDSRLWPLYYAAAAVVASSRTYVKIHHASDVVAGVATGLVIGRVARKAWPKSGMSRS
ncbi:MAG TPA: phosphatase PAP2 family protein [Acidimicrobiales bacterium]|nr:phosphatase PAP2 family protein [Acidimicrobiales bacterium]